MHISCVKRNYDHINENELFEKHQTFNHALAHIIYAWKCFSTFRYTRRDLIKHSTAKEVYLRRTKEQPAGDNSVSLSCLYSIKSSCSHPIFGSLMFQSNRVNFALGKTDISPGHCCITTYRTIYYTTLTIYYFCSKKIICSPVPARIQDLVK